MKIKISKFPLTDLFEYKHSISVSILNVYELIQESNFTDKISKKSVKKSQKKTDFSKIIQNLVKKRV